MTLARMARLQTMMETQIYMVGRMKEEVSKVPRFD
jgi:hypothetical protein